MSQRVLQLTEICDYLNLKKTDDLEKILAFLINLLVYTKEGVQIKTSAISFEKLSGNLIYVDSSIKGNISELLTNQKIVRIPI